jgi:glycerophosphoryl diester phosphodiesterase
MTRPLVIAHRGLSSQHPENTLPAFEAAVACGADMIELDITLTADGHFMVIHDDTLSRTTSAQGFVGHLRKNDLQQLDAGKWFDNGDVSTPIPTIDEVLDRIGGRIQLNIEVKPFFPLNQAGRMQAGLSRLLTILEERDLRSTAIFSSVNFYLLEYLRELDDDLRLGLIFRRPLTDFDPEFVCRAFNIWSLHPFHEQVDEALMRSMHDMGVKVFPYTVNSRTRMRELLKLGVDGMFTDTPEVMIEELAAQ